MKRFPQSTSQLGLHLERESSGAVTAGCCFQCLSCWRAEAEGGRSGVGGAGGRQSGPASPQVYLHIPPAGGPGARGAGGLPSPPAHTRPRRLSIRLAVLGLLFTTKVHAWQEEGQPQSGRPGLRAVAPAWLPSAPDSACWRRWPRKDASTPSPAGKAANNWSCRARGRGETTTDAPCGHKQVSPGAGACPRSPENKGLLRD